MLVWTRDEPIRMAVVHVNVGPDMPGTGAEWLADYLDSIAGGYHQVHDDDSSLTLAQDMQCVAGARGGDANERGLHHCVIGDADQSSAQWDDAFSRAAIKRCASAVALDCKQHRIQPKLLTGATLRDPNQTGICGHVHVSQAWNVVEGHYDPGPHFPWAKFIAQVQVAMGVVKVEDDMPKGAQAQVETPSGKGYWIVDSNGAVFAYGDAKYFGGMNDKPHAAPIVDIAPTKTGNGYWLLGQDGGVFSFGDAAFHGAPTGKVR